MDVKPQDRSQGPSECTILRAGVPQGKRGVLWLPHFQTESDPGSKPGEPQGMSPRADIHGAWDPFVLDARGTWLCSRSLHNFFSFFCSFLKSAPLTHSSEASESSSCSTKTFPTGHSPCEAVASRSGSQVCHLLTLGLGST